MSGWDHQGNGYFTALADGVLTLTFNAPEARNPFRQSMAGDFTTIFTRAKADPAVRCLLVQGAGDHLTAGGDIAGFKRALDQPVADLQAEFHQRLDVAAGMVAAMLAFDRPVLVRARGAVAGAGMLMPLAADLVIGDETATFVFAYNRLGLSPDGGVSWLLPRAVGERQARRLLLTAATVGAEEARQLGLLDQLVPAADLDQAVAKAARGFAQGSQGAISRTKALLAAAPLTPLADHLAAERDGIVASVAHPDFAEAVNAFLEKRKPAFR